MFQLLTASLQAIGSTVSGAALSVMTYNKGF